MTTKTSTTTNAVVSYAAAYATLAGIAERLKAPGTAASIDTLAQDVVMARQAYEQCSNRIKAIRDEIDAEIASDCSVSA